MSLPDQLAAEIAALPTMENYTVAQRARNGLRKKYLDKLDAAVAAGTADRGRRFSIASKINNRVDRYIANHAPIQCEETGWAPLKRKDY